MRSYLAYAAGRLLGLAACVLVLLFGGPAAALAQSAACTVPIVQTSSGPVCGFLQPAEARAVRAYLGIPYAQSPAGQNRWKPPIAAEPSGTVIQATRFGPACPQKKGPDSPYSQSEDCLSLNVWAPETASKRPVMVFIHGGAFVEGTSAAMLYEGQVIAAKGDVVVVTINYRLGALGFLAGVEGLTGNYGFLDQQLALRWVHDNITSFGGDPGNVTLFGESAGAISIGAHLIAPDSQSLFHAAIMQSNPYGLPFRSLDMSNRSGASLRRDMACSTDESHALDCMRQAPLKLILKYQNSVGVELEGLLTGMSDILQWSPIVDRRIIPHQPIQAEITKPVIIGTNAMEGMAFAGAIDQVRRDITEQQYRAAIDVLFDDRSAAAVLSNPVYAPRAGDNSEPFGRLTTDFTFTCAGRHVLSRAKSRAYAYLFTHRTSYITWPHLPFCALPDGTFQACHTAELPFVFGNPYQLTDQQNPERHRFTADEKTLSDAMIRYWTTFATRHDLRGAQPAWPAYPSTQILDTPIRQATSDIGANCNFWDQIGYEQTGIFREF